MPRKASTDDQSQRDVLVTELLARVEADLSEWDALQLFSRIADLFDWSFEVRAMGGLTYRRAPKRRFPKRA